MSKNISNRNYLIYLNLHSKDPKTFSVKHKGLVASRFEHATVVNASFVVHKSGHYRANLEQKRNVHAYVSTQTDDNIKPLSDFLNITLLSDELMVMAFPVHYHYKDGDCFKVRIGERLINLDSDYVFPQVFMSDHKCYIPKKWVFKYLLERKFSPKQVFEMFIPQLYEPFLNNIKWLLSLETELRNGNFKHFTNNQEFYENAGICCNTHSCFDQFLPSDGEFVYRDARTIFNCISNNIFTRWPEFSGDETYPIKVFDALNPDTNGEEQYQRHPNKWQGDLLEARLCLLKFMLQELEGE